MRLWVVSELYWPEQTSTGYFMTEIAEGLAAGHEVRVLCGQPTYSARGVVAPRRETRNGVLIFRCAGTRFDKDRLLLRLLNALTLSTSIGWAVFHHVRRGDRILVVTNPPSLPFVVTAAAALRGVRIVLRIEDVYPDVLVATGVLRSGAFIVRTLNSLTRRLYRRMERVIVLGRDAAALAAEKLADRQDRIALIPNWGDVERVRPMPRDENKVLEQLAIRDRFVIQYMGNMGRTHGVETVAHAARALRGRSECHFLFVGWGARKAWLERTVRDEKLTNVTVVPGCSQKELPDYANACDVSVIALLTGMAGVSVPSRMYNVMAAGKPIIAVADPDSELASVVLEERIGWVVPPEDPQALAAAIEHARRNRHELPAMGDRARAAAERAYSKSLVLRQYDALLRELEAGGSSADDASL